MIYQYICKLIYYPCYTIPLNQTNVLAHFEKSQYCEACFDRPLPSETNCLEGPLVFGRLSPIFQCQWTCHQRSPVLRDLTFNANGILRQVLLYICSEACRCSHQWPILHPVVQIKYFLTINKFMGHDLTSIFLEVNNFGLGHIKF